MRYLFILSDVETEQIRPGDPGFEARTAEYLAFDAMTKERGIHLASGRLRPTSAATTVQVRNGKTLLTDGPFAETREQMGGFYLLECRDHAEACELAARIPTASHGSVEVRPLFV